MMRFAKWSVGAMLMSLTLLVGCNKAPDTKDQVSKALKDANLDNVSVDFDETARVVHLKGAVDTVTEKSRAEDVARRAAGAAGAIANELTVKGVDEHTADDMDNEVRKELNAKVENTRALQGRDINFDVNNGVVTIKGKVATASEKNEVGQMAKSTQNVKDVLNSLELDPKLASRKMAAPVTKATAHPVSGVAVKKKSDHR
ncbi:MAG: BON domain-containing protein [Vicinamibacterales bacterium]